MKITVSQFTGTKEILPSSVTTDLLMVDLVSISKKAKNVNSELFWAKCFPEHNARMANGKKLLTKTVVFIY